MLRLIYGCPGSDKSAHMHRLIAERLKCGKKVILIVPERFSVSVEQELTRLCEEENGENRTNLMNLEILSFKRLCNRVFREYGGLCCNYPGKGSRMLMMWRALAGVKGDLKAYGGVRLRDSATIEAMLESIVSIKRAAILPTDLEKAAERCADKPALQSKLSDLSKIYAAYEELLKSRGFDDPEQDLTRLYRILGDHRFFEDKEVFIDSTAAFTGQELNVVKRALEQSPAVTVCFEYLPEDSRPMLDKLRWCDSLVRGAALEAGAGAPEELRFIDAPHKRKDLSHLEKQLFSESVEVRKGKERSLRADSCADLYEECRTVAARILRDVQNGGRYKEHCVVARDLSAYAGILDRVLESNGVPYTMTAKKPLLTRGACRLVSAALRLIAQDFRTEDLTAYLKTGYSGLEDDDCFLLEDYLNLWRPEGEKRWLRGGDFAMNPDGHTGEWREEGKNNLARINEAKRILTEPLQKLAGDFSACRTVEEYAAVLFEYIEDMKLSEALAREQELCRQARDMQEALYHAQTYGALCDLLDDLVRAMSGYQASAEDFSRMFDLLAGKKLLGSIPPGKDRVLITDPFNLKPGEVRVLHAVGVNEGVFPASVSVSGMFSRRERSILKEMDLELPGNDERAAYDEEYLCYSVLTLPKEQLYVTNHKKDLRGAPCKPSELFETLAGFYGESANGEEDLLYGAANCLETAFEGEESGDARAAVLRTIFEEKEKSFAAGAGAAPLVSCGDRLSKESTALVYPEKSPVMSQTKIETFVGCPLSYTCKYLLSLKETPTEDPGGNEIGSIVHEVLEKLIGGCIAGGISVGTLTNEELHRRIDASLETIKRLMVGEETPLQIEQLFRRLKNNLYVLSENLRDEFAQSSFQPVYCEIRFGDGKKKPGDTLLPGIETKGEFSLKIVGTVDRVDAFSKDGRIYLRVVDYKTYNKDFSENDIKKEQNLQMPLYMRALLENDDPEFLSRIGAKQGDKLLPAAILYHIVNLPKAQLPERKDDEAIRDAIKKSIKRTGLLLEDKEIMEAMDRSLDGSFMPAGAGKRAIPEDRFIEDLESLDGILSDIASRMRRGDAQSNIDPNTCRFCPMGPICRRESKFDGSGDDEGGAE